MVSTIKSTILHTVVDRTWVGKSVSDEEAATSEHVRCIGGVGIIGSISPSKSGSWAKAEDSSYGTTA